MHIEEVQYNATSCISGICAQKDSLGLSLNLISRVLLLCPDLVVQIMLLFLPCSCLWMTAP